MLETVVLVLDGDTLHPVAAAEQVDVVVQAVPFAPTGQMVVVLQELAVLRLQLLDEVWLLGEIWLSEALGLWLRALSAVGIPDLITIVGGIMIGGGSTGVTGGKIYVPSCRPSVR